MNRVLLGVVAVLAIAFVAAIILALVARHGEVRRMHRQRKGSDFGVLGGQRWVRCHICGIVDAPHDCKGE